MTATDPAIDFANDLMKDTLTKCPNWWYQVRPGKTVKRRDGSIRYDENYPGFEIILKSKNPDETSEFPICRTYAYLDADATHGEITAQVLRLVDDMVEGRAKIEAGL